MHGDGKVVIVDNVLWQTNIKHQSITIPSPLPPQMQENVNGNFNSRYFTISFESESLHETYFFQQQKVVELQELLDQQRSENCVLVGKVDEIRHRALISVGIQAVDSTAHEGLADIQRKLEENISKLL